MNHQWDCGHYLDSSRLDYLGSTEYSYTLNFSKPAAPIVAQMYNFLNLGFEGYRKIATKDLRNARTLSRALEKTYFKARDFPRWLTLIAKLT